MSGVGWLEGLQFGAVSVLLALLGIFVPALMGSLLRIVHSQFWKVRHIPQPPVSGWLTGHLLPLARNDYYHQVLEWANQLGPVFRFRIFFRTNIVVADPVLVQQVR